MLFGWRTTLMTGTNSMCSAQRKASKPFSDKLDHEEVEIKRASIFFSKIPCISAFHYFSFNLQKQSTTIELIDNDPFLDHFQWISGLELFGTQSGASYERIDILIWPRSYQSAKECPFQHASYAHEVCRHAHWLVRVAGRYDILARCC